MATLGATGIFK